MAEPVLHKGQKRDRSWLRCYANRVTMVEQHYTNVLQLAVCRPKLHGVVQVVESGIRVEFLSLPKHFHALSVETQGSAA
eukprot:1057477-Pyramimonas_sp.AAC.1